MKSERFFDIPGHIVARGVGGETVILDLDRGKYFGLDPIGARFWELMASGESLSSIQNVMVQEYEVSAEQLESDLSVLLNSLMATHLITERT